MMGEASSIDIEKFIALEEGVYWWILNITFILMFLWVFFFLFTELNLAEKYADSGIASNLKSAADYAFPLLGNAAFLPIIVTLLNVFVCSETIGDDIHDAVLDKDCHENCWQGIHWAYVSGSAVCLFIYVPTAVYMRPSLQKHLYDLNVTTLPLYLICKSVFQLWLIMLAKTLAIVNVIAHSIVYFISIVLFTLLIFKMRPYNYNRFNLWQVFIFVCLCWVALLNIGNLAFSFEALTTSLLLFIGLGVIAGAFGVI